MESPPCATSPHACRRWNIARHSRFEKAKAFLHIRKQPALAQLGLHALDLGAKGHVVAEKRSVAFELALHQGVLDEQLARGAWIDGAVMNSPRGDEDQAVKADFLSRNDLRPVLVPFRVCVLPLDQMRADMGQGPGAGRFD